MKTLLALFIALTLASCAVMDNLVGVADTTISIPSARADLEAYLTDDELASVSDELALLDKTYQPIADVIFGQSDISLQEAIKKALGTVLRQAELENAYKAIRAVVRAHRDSTKTEALPNGEPVPANLARVSAEIESLWDDWESVIASNQRALAYINLAAKIALPL